eukprot:gene56034-74808_t
MEYNLGIGSRIKHPNHGEGVVINVKSSSLQVTFMSSGYREIPNTDEIEVIDEMWSDVTESTSLLGEKWTGGKMILQPGRKDLATKEVPIEQFFHKIVMLRDRLRTMEQKVNASNLSDEAK